MSSRTVRLLTFGLFGVLALTLLVLIISAPNDSLIGVSQNGIALLIPITFHAGKFSFLSPCTLPI